MRTYAALAPLFLAYLVVAAPAPKLKPNLLKNGSFEEGRKIADYFSLGPGDTYVTDWVATRGSIDIVDRYWKAAHGNRSIDLHGSPGFGGIQQTFKTVPGKKYTVSFSLAVNPDCSFPKKKMGVSAAKQSQEFTIDGTGNSRANPGWERKSWRFTAADKETTLELYTLMNNDDACGPIIDDVSVVEFD